MRKSKLFLLMACMVVTMSACQSKEAKPETTDAPVVEENTEEKDTAEESEKSEESGISQYEGLTLEEVENLGFEVCGYCSSIGSGSNYCIELTARKDDYIDLTFTIAEIDKEENERISSERDAADDSTEYMYNYIKENYPENTISNCKINYQIYGHDMLLQAYADGACEKCENMENRTMEELYVEGYEFESKQGGSVGMGDDMQYEYLVYLEKDEEECIVVLDAGGNQALGELEFGVSDEEVEDAIKGATVVEAYQLNKN